ncbi:MT-A70 family methyltransferase [Ruegeria arenilitoris]|uniref:MT-A70 family methyltransferase n=1 Tax=Ruegeria arenilitoris TaxID=1173585 RepID=UPI00147E978E|nr:MT-A70 family methyltransferase [Ruegeria arenilitoris]
MFDSPKLPSGPFEIIVSDPPWRFASNSDAKPGRNARRHYPCMTDAELMALPVAESAAENALLFGWTTAPMMERSLRVFSAWGFKYVSQLVWTKERIGTGFWVRNQHEICLLMKRGKFPCPKPAPFETSIIGPWQGRHSEKPEFLQDRIDQIWPAVPKLEMFARRVRPGWALFGNEIPNESRAQEVIST